MRVKTVRRYLFYTFVMWIPLFAIQFDAMANDEVVAPEEIVWLSDYSRALDEARATDKPILVAFRCVP